MREITSKFVQKTCREQRFDLRNSARTFYESIVYLDMTLMGAGYCSNCNVQMERTYVTADGAGGLHIETERDGGMLNRLGVGHRLPLSAPFCPEYAVMQLYADRSE